ncbi:unnamed protein product [Caenorhabditis auriculariae]|uniref:Methyltransferase FkbM domain-containing protein n=1 Tax=Caenorhabditis auriculariae TaxID=2777116 RepID=A0A8S1HFQ1_9PELO|nr:unnamed protein product [Caenorhabditis auriculariae]
MVRILGLLLIIEFEGPKPYEKNEAVIKAYKTWKKCFEEKLWDVVRNHNEKVWLTLPEEIARCRNLTLSRIIINKVPNSDDEKNYVGVMQTKPAIVVTLGVGFDVAVEKKLKNELPKGSLFFGADPISDKNEKIFSEIGTFFPVAVAATSKLANASVLKTEGGFYKNKLIEHVGFVDFVENYVRQKFIDILLLDNEGPEWDIFPMMTLGGELDQRRITICQMSVEFHYDGPGTRPKLVRLAESLLKGEMIDGFP